MEKSQVSMLQDLPVETLEFILIEVVVGEVRSEKVAKKLWKEMAVGVMSRLKCVCKTWNCTISANTFKQKVNKILDSTAGAPYIFEIVEEFSIPRSVRGVALMNQEICLLFKSGIGDDHIRIYDRKNPSTLKAIIPLPGIYPVAVAASSKSNFFHILSSDYVFSVRRISVCYNCNHFHSERLFNLRLMNPTMAVSTNGSFIISTQQKGDAVVVRLYDEKGSELHSVRVSADVGWIRDFIAKENGNIILVSSNEKYKTELVEYDMDGNAIRHYESSIFGYSGANIADSSEKILLTNPANEMELIDDRFNLLDLTGPTAMGYQLATPNELCYDAVRNEVVRLYHGHGAVCRIKKE